MARSYVLVGSFKQIYHVISVNTGKAAAKERDLTFCIILVDGRKCVFYYVVGVFYVKRICARNAFLITENTVIRAT